MSQLKVALFALAVFLFIAFLVWITDAGKIIGDPYEDPEYKFWAELLKEKQEEVEE
jgi:hypothetical protein